MEILVKAFGIYQTNCYILKNEKLSFVIDPGQNSFEWVKKNANNAKAILCTHGHFDHIFDVAKIKNFFKIPVYIHKEDAFFLKSNFNMGYQTCDPDFEVKEEQINIDEYKFYFHHFPGHTPGCSMIEFENLIFSGDFLFKGSIGRWDFEFSNKEDMVKSLEKCEKIQGEYTIFPGHGEESLFSIEKKNLKAWRKYILMSA